MSSSSPANYKNPFKKDGGGEGKSTPSGDTNKTDMDSSKGLSMIDAWKKPSEKPSMEFNPTKPLRASKNSKKGSEKDKTEKGKANNSAATSGKVSTIILSIFFKVIYLCILSFLINRNNLPYFQ
jgi:hypothetical protein